MIVRLPFGLHLIVHLIRLEKRDRRPKGTTRITQRKPVLVLVPNPDPEDVPEPVALMRGEVH